MDLKFRRKRIEMWGKNKEWVLKNYCNKIDIHINTIGS